MKLHAVCLTGALIVTAIPVSAGAVPIAADSRRRRQRSARCGGYVHLPSRLLLGAGRLCPARQV
jgi:hypothetical protein